MQQANDVTIAALRHVHSQVAVGMSASDISALMDHTTLALGGSPGGFSLVLLNEASAYPHGSVKPQSVREGSVILMDCGCVVHGYESDISRTWVFGQANARQRKVWNTVKRGQELALDTAKLDAPVGGIDDDSSQVLRNRRLGSGLSFARPLSSHRTWHRIGWT